MKLLKIAAVGGLALAVAGAALASPPRRPAPFRPQLVLYAGPNYVGEYRILRASVPRLVEVRFNDRTSSLRATGRWQICTDPYYSGRCTVVRGGYAGLGELKMSDKISSVRYIGP